MNVFTMQSEEKYRLVFLDKKTNSGEIILALKNELEEDEFQQVLKTISLKKLAKVTEITICKDEELAILNFEVKIRTSGMQDYMEKLVKTNVKKVCETIDRNWDTIYKEGDVILNSGMNYMIKNIARYHKKDGFTTHTELVLYFNTAEK